MTSNQDNEKTTTCCIKCTKDVAHCTCDNEKKCTCLEDNKMSQAMCPVHSTPKEETTWEERFRKLVMYTTKIPYMADGLEIDNDIVRIIDFFSKEIALAKLQTVDDILKLGQSSKGESDFWVISVEDITNYRNTI